MVYFINLDVKKFIIALKNREDKDWDDEDIKKLFIYLDENQKREVKDLNDISQRSPEGIFHYFDMEKLKETSSNFLKIYFYCIEKKNEIIKKIDDGKTPDWLKPLLLEQEGPIGQQARRFLWGDDTPSEFPQERYLGSEVDEDENLDPSLPSPEPETPEGFSDLGVSDLGAGGGVGGGKRRKKSKSKNRKNKGKSKRKRSKTRRRR